MKIKSVGASGGQEQICMKEREAAGGVRDIKARLAQAKRQQTLALLFLDFPESFCRAYSGFPSHVTTNSIFAGCA
jgi:hypothetical protein